MSTTICPVCGKEFTSDWNKIYCSVSCKNKYFYHKNKIKIKKYRMEHKDRDKIYREKNKKRRSEWQKERLKIDLNFKLRTYLTNRLYGAVKTNSKSSSTLELLGCSIQELKFYLENQFKPGMTWDNHGLWHIDHVIPCCSFDLSDPEQQKICFHYTNLQPLWAEENLRKGVKINWQ